jgi:hypothetical protein
MLVRADYRTGTQATRYYLRCSCNQTGLQCENNRTPRYNWFERKFLAALPGIPWRQLVKNIPRDNATDEVTHQIEEVASQIDGLKRVSSRLLKVIEDEDEPDAEIVNRRRDVQAQIATLNARKIVLVRDRAALERNAATDDKVVDEAAELVRMMDAAGEAGRYVIRQKLHAVLWQIVERAMFYEHGLARVQIRGGFVIEIPLDEHTPAGAGIRMGGQPAYHAQLKASEAPLTPNADMTRLVRPPKRDWLSIPASPWPSQPQPKPPQPAVPATARDWLTVPDSSEAA